MFPLVLQGLARAGDEAPAAAAVYGAAEACQQCLTAVGVTPQWAGPVAVVIAVAARPVLDEAWRWTRDAARARSEAWRRRRAERQPKTPPETP